MKLKISCLYLFMCVVSCNNLSAVPQKIAYQCIWTCDCSALPEMHRHSFHLIEPVWEQPEALAQKIETVFLSQKKVDLWDAAEFFYNNISGEIQAANCFQQYCVDFDMRAEDVFKERTDLVLVLKNQIIIPTLACFCQKAIKIMKTLPRGLMFESAKYYLKPVFDAIPDCLEFHISMLDQDIQDELAILLLGINRRGCAKD